MLIQVYTPAQPLSEEELENFLEYCNKSDYVPRGDITENFNVKVGQMKENTTVVGHRDLKKGKILVIVW